MAKSKPTPTNHRLTVGTTTIDYQLVRTARKTMAIHVFPDGRVVVRAPMRAAQREIVDLLTSRIDWVLRHQARFKQRARTAIPPKQYIDGDIFHFLGRPYRLKVSEDRSVRVRLDGDELIVTVADTKDTKRIAALIEKWYRQQAKRIFDQRLDVCFPRVAAWKVSRPELRVRKMRSRWGSCSSRGRVTMNIHLIQAPEALIDYVMLHELCHLKQMNHSPAFWALMDEVLPDWRERRKALKILQID